MVVEKQRTLTFEESMSNFIFKSFPQLIVVASLLLSSNDAYASGGPMDPVPQFVNLLILIGIITFVYQSKIKPVLVARAEQIKNDLTRGQKELEIAQAHAEEVNKEYSELDAKIADIHSQAQEDIAAMKVSFAEQMKAEEARIASSTERSIQDELSRAKKELHEESVTIALTIAENLVRNNVTTEDQSRFKQQFIRAVEKEGSNV